MEKIKSLRTSQMRITIWIDTDLLKAIQKLALAERMKYQPFLNRILRGVVFKKEKEDK
jgi:predicted DNA binding CopG/RHH family protein